MGWVRDITRIQRRYGGHALKGAGALASNLLGYFNSGFPPGAPLFVSWDYTYKCDIRCLYCFRREKHRPGRELQTGERLALVRELGSIGVWLLTISGGEPLLCDDIFKVVGEAKASGLNVNLDSNGQGLLVSYREIARSGADILTIGIDSESAQEQDAIRGRKGMFQMMRSGLEKLKGERRGGRPALIGRINVHKRNFSSLGEVIAGWKPYFDDFILQPLHDSHATGFKIPQDFAFEKSDEAAFRKSFGGFLKKHRKLDTTYHRRIPDFIFKRELLMREYRCFASFVFVSIDPSGDVFPCNDYVSLLGNVRNGGFKSALESGETSEFRKSARSRKLECSCWYNCNGVPNCYLSGPAILRSRR
jgi:radical SAM protein with 4Fe4S-binding SPASM domain